MDIIQTHNGFGDNIVQLNNFQQRSIENIKQDFVAALSPFKENYKIYLSIGDAESEMVAKQFESFLDSIGWNKQGFIYKLAGQYPNGITIGTPEAYKSAEILVNLLNKNGFKVGWEKHSEELLGIYVGPNRR